MRRSCTGRFLRASTDIGDSSVMTQQEEASLSGQRQWKAYPEYFFMPQVQCSNASAVLPLLRE